LSAAVRKFTGQGPPQFARVLAWVRHSSHVYWPGSAAVRTCTGLVPPKFTRVLAWVHHSSHVYWPGSATVHTCTGLGLPQFTRILAWIRHSSPRILAWTRHSSQVYWPGSTAVHMCTGRGWNRELRVDRLTNNGLNCDGSLLRLEDKHPISCVDCDKCGLFYILLAIDVVTSDLFGVPHSESRVVECYR